MLKKHLKNILLIFSVLLAFVLVFQIWFSSFFLPEGYEFFLSGIRHYIVNPIENFFRQMNGGDFSQDLKVLLRPETIVVHSAGERRAFNDGEPGFEEVYGFSNDILSELLTGGYPVKSKEIVDTDTYHSVLKGKSIFVNYGKTCDYRLLSFSVSGETPSRFTEDLSAVKSYSISLQDGIMNNVSIFITDQKSGNIYRYVVELDKNSLEGRIADVIHKAESVGPLSYSFELNFHKTQEEAPAKILFEPTLLMELVPVEMPAYFSRPSESFGEGANSELLDEILQAFSINTRSMWWYTDLSNARIFVENDATLSVHPEGYFEYQVVGDGRGLDISTNKASYDIYAATTDAVDFVAELCRYMPEDYFENLRIQTDLLDDSTRQGSYTICFDYCLGGVPVRYERDGRFFHAIEMEISGGYLRSYRQHIKSYDSAETLQAALIPVLQAGDLLVDGLYNGVDPLYVSEIEPCYIDVSDVSGVIVPKWSATVDGTEQIIG